MKNSCTKGIIALKDGMRVWYNIMGFNMPCEMQ